MPSFNKCSFTDLMGTSFLWKMPAARAADAFVFVKTSEKCSAAPAPLLAITGMLTESDINFIKSISNPVP
uniref:Imidazole glycerol phosphate synthase hisHFic n=1 Tax=Rhizophora mucronata TaxID=61149 RepID=A0A2P2LBM1_RHIMU